MPSKLQQRLIKHLLSKNENGGFTLVELIVASGMAMTLIGAAYFFLNSTMLMNKTNKRNMEMNASLQETLTEITDEIRSGMLIITEPSKYNSLCKVPINGELVLAIQFPPQALRASDYKPSNENVSKLDNSFGCPIAYLLKPSQESEFGEYTLYRYGPPINQKGYYTNQAYISSPILYGVTPKPIREVDCDKDKFSSAIKGIQLCSDRFGKYAEISISTEINDPVSGISQAYMSTSAFSRINDFAIADQIYGSIYSKESSPCNNKDTCDFLGQSITSKGVTFAIRTSNYMYPYTFGGLTFLDFMKAELTKTVENLAEGTTLQIITLEGRERYGEKNRQLWETPKVITRENKDYAINWISNNMTPHKNARGVGYRTPMLRLGEILENKHIGQLVVVSGWDLPNYANCKFDIKSNPTGETQQLGKCFKKYNEEVRSNSPEGKIRVDVITMGANASCRETTWAGELTSNMDGKCNVIE